MTKKQNEILEEINVAMKIRASHSSVDCVITSQKVGKKEVVGFHFEPLGKYRRGDNISLTNTDVLRVEAII